MNNHELRHRNPHPDDQLLFNTHHISDLQKAVYELSWLFNQGYNRHSSIKFVGDHYQLKQRQRTAVARVACSDDSKKSRKDKCLDLSDIKNRHLVIDGFNLIITLESAMAQSLLLLCSDGCIRDLASVHGTYRQVRETKMVIELVGRTLAVFRPASVQWFFDKPVSNSGRLVNLVRKIASNNRWNWQAKLLENPDQAISSSHKIAITSDSVVLDAVDYWVNLTAYVLEQNFDDAWLVDIS